MYLKICLMNSRFLRACALLAALSFATAAASATDFVVIANPGANLTGLSREQVADLFFGKSASLPGLCCPILIDQPESSPLREAFYNRVAGKSAAQAKSSWAKMYFTGKGIPPKEGKGNDEIRAMVAANRNMLGYIDRSAADSSVRIVFGEK